MKTAQRISLLFFISILVACASLGLPTATTFNERALTAAATITEVTKTTSVLLQADKITPDDASNIQGQIHNAEQAITVARSLAKTDIAAADNRMTAIIAGLTALQAYLGSQK